MIFSSNKNCKNSILLLLILICYIYLTKDINYLNKSYKKKFIFSNFSYNYYNIFTKLILIPRSSIKYLNILNDINLNKNDVILDIGCGDGFNLLYFNKNYNFKKIIGVEIDKNIYDVCKQNLNMIDSNKIKIFNQNILKYNFPNDLSIIYLFNPFQQNYLTKDCKQYNKYKLLVKKIKQSFLSNKRSIKIIFINLNDKKIFEIFNKYFRVFKEGYFLEFLVIKINYIIFYID